MQDKEQLKTAAKGFLEKEDHANAIGILRELEALGDEWGIYALSKCYKYGLGVPKDSEVANKLLKNAADLGYVDAKAQLGNDLVYGIEIDKDVALGVRYLEEAAEEENRFALYVLGELYLKGEQGFAADPAKTIKYFTKSAELGYDGAMQRLAWMYEHGIGAPVDHARAVFLNETAADLGNVYAAYNLSGSYKNGVGVPVDHEKFLHYLRIAADGGLVYAIHNLASSYCKGEGVDINPELGRELYAKAAYMGSGLSSYNLSTMYELGEGGAKDMALAAVWASTAIEQFCHKSHGAFERLVLEMSQEDIERTVGYLRIAAEKGLHWAQRTVAKLYERGYLVEKDEKLSAYWAEAAHGTRDQTDLIREQFKISGFAEGIFNAAREHEKNNRVDEAAELLYEAACLGDGQAQCRLGEYYQPGGLIGNSNEKGLYWFSKAADQDNSRAELWLAVKYANGDGVEKNQESANYFYMRAATHGNAEAQAVIGNWYVTGKNVEQDYEAAAFWFFLAAQQGNFDAIIDLGLMHKRGLYFEKDPEKSRVFYRVAATGGNAMAQYLLGLSLVGTEDTEMVKDGISWLEAAGEQNHVEALNFLGMAHINGEIKNANHAKAFAFFKKAADLGDAEGMVSLGVCYAKGNGCAVDQEKAIEAYGKSAELGHPQGQFNLAWCYHFGEGVDQDFDKAKLFYEQSAIQGNPGGLRGLAQIFESGLGGVQPDIQKAAELFIKAADGGDVIAQFELGCLYEDGRGVEVDRQKAEKYFLMAALQGHRSSQLNLGTLYMQGVDGTPDYQEALVWFQHAYENGHPKAGAAIGYIFLEGLGVDKDPVRALAYYENGAEQGDVCAQYNLALILQGNDSIPADAEKSLLLLVQAAMNNFPPAQVELAIELIKGETAGQDFAEAYKWLLIAEKLGDERAVRVKEYCEANADEGELANGKVFADAYFEEFERNA